MTLCALYNELHGSYDRHEMVKQDSNDGQLARCAFGFTRPMLSGRPAKCGSYSPGGNTGHLLMTSSPFSWRLCASPRMAAHTEIGIFNEVTCDQISTDIISTKLFHLLHVSDCQRNIHTQGEPK